MCNRWQQLFKNKERRDFENVGGHSEQLHDGCNFSNRDQRAARRPQFSHRHLLQRGEQQVVFQVKDELILACNERGHQRERERDEQPQQLWLDTGLPRHVLQLDAEWGVLGGAADVKDPAAPVFGVERVFAREHELLCLASREWESEQEHYCEDLFAVDYLWSNIVCEPCERAVGVGGAQIFRKGEHPARVSAAVRRRGAAGAAEWIGFFGLLETGA